MAHPRKLIRHAVVALLSGATAAGVRVQGTRVDPHKKTQLPALSVYTLNDLADEDISTEAEQAHALQLEIAGWVAHADAVPADDAMDDLAEQIEAAMNGDRYLSGLAGESRLVGTAMEIREEDGRSSPLVGIVVLTYEVTYRTDLVAEPPVEDFLRVGAEHRIVGAVAANAANDRFTVQETP
jgi:hypothetical protein